MTGYHDPLMFVLRLVVNGNRIHRVSLHPHTSVMYVGIAMLPWYYCIVMHAYTHVHTHTHNRRQTHQLILLCPSNLTHGIVADLVGVRRTLQIPLSNLATTRRIEACLLAISIRLVHSVPQFAVS